MIRELVGVSAFELPECVSHLPLTSLGGECNKVTPSLLRFLTPGGFAARGFFQASPASIRSSRVRASSTPARLSAEKS